MQGFKSITSRYDTNYIGITTGGSRASADKSLSRKRDPGPRGPQQATTIGESNEETASWRHRPQRPAGAEQLRRPCPGYRPLRCRRRTLSAILQQGCVGQMGRFRNRPDGRRLRPDECEMLHRRGGLGRHHPGAAGGKIRRDLVLHADHREAQADHRLHRQVLSHARRDSSGRSRNRSPSTSRIPTA